MWRHLSLESCIFEPDADAVVPKSSECERSWVTKHAHSFSHLTIDGSFYLVVKVLHQQLITHSTLHREQLETILFFWPQTFLPSEKRSPNELGLKVSESFVETDGLFNVLMLSWVTCNYQQDDPPKNFSWCHHNNLDRFNQSQWNVCNRATFTNHSIWHVTWSYITKVTSLSMATFSNKNHCEGRSPMFYGKSRLNVPCGTWLRNTKENH